MTDDQWLRAIARHNGVGRKADHSVGGARELSEILKQRTSESPSRFARLAMRMTASVNSAYPCAILWGFGEAEITPGASPLMFDAVRHIMNLGMPECDRWLGWSVRQLLDETPIDLVRLITERALSAPDPKLDQPARVSALSGREPVSYTHLTLPTILLV